MPAGGSSCRRHSDEILVSIHRLIHSNCSSGDEKSECIVGSAWRGPGSGVRGPSGGPLAPRRGHAGNKTVTKRNGWASRGCELL